MRVKITLVTQTWHFGKVPNEDHVRVPSQLDILKQEHNLLLERAILQGT